jgi:hypothetical protein
MSTIKMSGAARSTIDGHKVINAGRMSGGEHKHDIVATADKTPKRGDYDKGPAPKPFNAIGDNRKG